MDTHETYQSPLSGRYASPEMLSLFSDQTRYTIWRELWAALAESEMELGLPVTREQVEELKAHTRDIDFSVVAAREKEIRHDVMAHVYAYGKVCPKAEPIIHLGATSCYVTDNGDIIIYARALKLIREKLVRALQVLEGFAREYRALPTLGYTHLQAAQPVTVGKRATLWMQDFAEDFADLEYILNGLRLLGSKGTTGTQASFLALFHGDHAACQALDDKIAEKMGFSRCYPVSGQTYPRKLDSRILSVLSGVAQSAYKFANDIRVLQSFGELEEPFEKNQVGSSAMAYKRNPMRSERICSLSRYIMADNMNPAMTASTQWMERTLDDSANRRIAMSEAFLAADAVLNLVINVSDGLVVYPAIIRRRLMENMPFMATENILMALTEKGGDRQSLHESIRRHSMEAVKTMKLEGKPCDLLERIAADPVFHTTREELESVMDPALYIGRCPQQVDTFLAEVIDPILASCPVTAPDAEIRV